MEGSAMPWFIFIPTPTNINAQFVQTASHNPSDLNAPKEGLKPHSFIANIKKNVTTNLSDDNQSVDQ